MLSNRQGGKGGQAGVYGVCEGPQKAPKNTTELCKGARAPVWAPYEGANWPQLSFSQKQVFYIGAVCALQLELKFGTGTWKQKFGTGTSKENHSR